MTPGHPTRGSQAATLRLLEEAHFDCILTIRLHLTTGHSWSSDSGAPQAATLRLLEEAQALFDRLADHIDVWEESLRAADAAADRSCGLTAPGVATQTHPPPMFPAQWLWVRSAHALLDRDEDDGGDGGPGAAGGGRGRFIAQAVDRIRRHSARKGSPKGPNWAGHAMAVAGGSARR